MQTVSGTKQLLTVKYDDLGNQLSDDKLSVGLQTREILRKIEVQGQRRQLMLGMRGFYNASVCHLLSRLPFKNQLLCDVRILNPKHRTDAGCLKSVERLAQKFCQSDYDTMLDEWKLFQQETNVPSILVSSTDNDSQKCSKRVDRYWNEISALKTAADHPIWQCRC